MKSSLLLAVLALSSVAVAQESAEVSEQEVEALAAAAEEAAAHAAAEEAQAERDAELEAMRARLERLEAMVSDQQVELDAARASVMAHGVELKKKPDLSFAITGYHRVRGAVYGAKWGEDKPVTGGLYEGQPTSGKIIRQRLRLGFVASYKQLASLHVDVQALDNVLMGDNADLASSPLFAETPSDTRIDGLEAPPIQVFRAWTEFRVPVGVLRVGRQSSHWGLGLLANNGDGFDDDFGENNYGNSFDRVLFGTNPISIVQTIAGKKGPEIPLTLAIAVDRLVEDPLTQYYGYKCSPGISRESDPDRYDDRCDVDMDGLTDLDHDYSEGREATERPESWWADQRDDVWEMVYALIYRGKGIRYFGGIGDLTVGTYIIHRTQKETESNVVVGDLYLDARVHGVQLQFEGVGIFGRTSALTLPDPSLDDPLAKKAGIFSYVARLGYSQPYWKLMMESGFASGDQQVNDELFSGRALHPDHNVGLLMYEEVLARVTARLWGSSARGLRSKGGVYNSHYINPRAYAYPLPNLEVIAGFLMAWPDQADGAVIRCTEADVAKGCAAAQATSDALGWELDFGIKHTWHKHLLLSVETGYAHITDRVPLQAAGLAANGKNDSGNFWTLQTRIAWQF